MRGLCELGPDLLHGGDGMCPHGQARRVRTMHKDARLIKSQFAAPRHHVPWLTGGAIHTAAGARLPARHAALFIPPASGPVCQGMRPPPPARRLTLPFALSTSPTSQSSTNCLSRYHISYFPSPTFAASFTSTNMSRADLTHDILMHHGFDDGANLETSLCTRLISTMIFTVRPCNIDLRFLP